MGRYLLHTVPNHEMPEGKDWLFIDEPGGDAHFVIGRNDRPVELHPELMVELLPKITATYQDGPKLRAV